MGATLSVAECHLPTQADGGQLSRAPQYASRDLPTTPLKAMASARWWSWYIEVLLRSRRAWGVGGIAFDSPGGAVNRVSPSATVSVHRNALFQAQYTTGAGRSAQSGGAPAACVARLVTWQRQLAGSRRDSMPARPGVPNDINHGAMNLAPAR